MGCPSAQAPPLIFSFSRGIPRSRCAAIATTANASLISNRSTSPTRQPTLSSSFRIAGIGAVVNHCGSWLWVAWPLISARDGSPSRSASERFARISAAAPSALAEEAAGGIVPPGRNAGFKPGILARAGLFLHRNRRDLGLERAAFDRLARAGQRFHGVGILIGAGERIGFRGGF